MNYHVLVHILIVDVVNVMWIASSVYKRDKCYVNCHMKYHILVVNMRKVLHKTYHLNL
jgi:hypothetical protein